MLQGAPDAHDHPVHSTYPPRVILLVEGYHPRRHQALCVQVALRVAVSGRIPGPTHRLPRCSPLNFIEHLGRKTSGGAWNLTCGEVANAEGTITMTELRKPHLTTLPPFEELRLEYSSCRYVPLIPSLRSF